MILSVFLVVGITAFVITILSALGKGSLWIAVLLLCIIEMLRDLPLGTR